MIKNIYLIAFAVASSFNLNAHDVYEITLEIQQKRHSVEARMEMAISTSVAACDPAPSNGVLFDPKDFSKWEDKFLEAAPDLMRLLTPEGNLSLESTKTELTREDDVRIKYVFKNQEGPLTLETPILNRFPPDGFGVLVTFRDQKGKWYPPFVIFLDDPFSSLPKV